MATNIEWTDETWQVTTGCEEVSPGCGHCYARTMAKRLRAMALSDIAAGRDPGKKRFYIDAVDDNGRWTKTVVPRPDALEEPLRWKKPRTVFVDSMSDLFHRGVPTEFIFQVFDVMVQAGYQGDHTFQVLTKRPERMAELTNRYIDCGHLCGAGPFCPDVHGGHESLPPFIWLGTSVEDQQRADERIPHLLRCPAAVRFLSCEPLLGPIDLTKYDCDGQYAPRMPIGLDWVIVGGESGHGARLCNLDWIQSLVNQCRAASTACFVKQLGKNCAVFDDEFGWMTTADIGLSDPKGGDISEFPESLRVREFPEVAHA